MEIKDLLNLINTFSSQIVGLSGSSETDSAKGSKGGEEPIRFQAPIKGNWYNSGNFSPGKATDARHTKGHDGLDMRTNLGTPFYPIAPGIVEKVYEDPVGGLAIVIKHREGYKSYYAHNNSISVAKGSKVDYDTQLGTVGYSGNAHPSRGGGTPHIHLQVWKDGSLINPASLFSTPAYSPIKSKEEVAALPGTKVRQEKSRRA